MIIIGCDQKENIYKPESPQLMSVPDNFQDPNDPLNIGFNHNYWLDEKISKWVDDEPEEWEEGLVRIDNFLSDVISRDTGVSQDENDSIVELAMHFVDSIDMDYMGDIDFLEKWFSFDYNRYDEWIDSGYINSNEQALMNDVFDDINALPFDANDVQIQDFIDAMNIHLDNWQLQNFNTNEGEGWASAALITVSIETSKYWLEEDEYSDEYAGALVKADIVGGVGAGVVAGAGSYYLNGNVDWGLVGVSAAAGAAGGTSGTALARAVDRAWKWLRSGD